MHDSLDGSLDPHLAWAALDTLPDGIAIIDAGGAIHYHNAAWQQLNGADDDALSGDATLADGMRTVLTGEQTQISLDYQHLDTDPPCWLAATLTVCTVVDERAVLVRLRDATLERRAAAERLGLIAQSRAAQAALEEVQRSQHLLRSIVDSTPDWIFIKDREHRYSLVNLSYASALHIAPENFIGKNDLELGFPEELVKGDLLKGIRGFWTDDREVMDTGNPIKNPHVPVMIDGELHIFDDVKMPLRDADGQVWGVLGIGRDVTERQRAEEVMRQRTLQDEIIRAQEAMLAELSTPLIPINERVMVMPLIGAMDTRRVEQVMEALLSGVAGCSAQVVILDITGVPVVDTQVANALVRAAQAVRLLGAQVVITGIRPEVAQTLVGLGTDLGGIVTRSSLQSGIAYAMKQN